jgi:hypothetical protein
MQSLEILEIKHNFHVDAVNVDKLHGPYPLVWRLVLDTPLTAAQTMHLIGLCPNVRDLQLHRTEISAEQVAAIGGMLPKLEVFWFKPKGELLAGHLQALQHFPELRIYSPQHATQSVPYEDGWEALRALPKLERLEVTDDVARSNAEAIQRLRLALPRLTVSRELTRSRNYDGI